MADIFISYKAERRPAVQYLARVLENHGYSVWFDYGLLSGAAFAPQIEREIRAASVVIALWCHLSVGSRWVLEEADLAAELGTLLPARIETVALPMGFRRLETLDLASWDGNPRSGVELTRLLDQVALKMGRDPIPTYRALVEQETQWRVHRLTLAGFPVDDEAARIEQKRQQQRGLKRAGAAKRPSPSAPESVGRIGEPAATGVRDERPLQPARTAWRWHPSQWVARVAGVARMATSPRAGEAIGILLIAAGLIGVAIAMRNNGGAQPPKAPDPTQTRAVRAPKKAVRPNAPVSVVPAGAPFVHEATARTIAFSPDDSRIATASYDDTVKVWDAASGQLLLTLTNHPNDFNSAAFSPDGGRIVTASDDRTARVWDATNGRPLATLVGHGLRVWGAAFSPDGDRIVTASADKTARIWEAGNGHLVTTLTGHSSDVYSAAFSLDGGRIATASYDDSVRVWDAIGGRLLLTLGGPPGAHFLGAAFSPDGRRIVAASTDKTAKVWNADSGQLLFTLSGHTAAVRTAAFSPDGRRILTASEDKTARIWDARSGRLIVTVTGHSNWLMGATFSSRGVRIGTASADRTARIWTIQNP